MITQEPHATYGDLGAAAIWIASIAQLLPSIAALLSVIWFAIRVLETPTVQLLLGRYAWIKTEMQHGNRQSDRDGSRDA